MPQATGLVAELKAAFPEHNFEFDVVRGDGGVFEVDFDGTRVFSKKRDGRFPVYQELPKQLRELIEA